MTFNAILCKVNESFVNINVTKENSRIEKCWLNSIGNLAANMGPSREGMDAIFFMSEQIYLI